MSARKSDRGPKRDDGSWQLTEPHAGMAQGMVVSGYDHLPTGEALFLEFAWDRHQRGGAWLAALNAIAPVTPADGKVPRSVSLSLSWTGLARMGLDQRALASFPQAFREGMYQRDRMRRLGDTCDGQWSDCVIPTGPRWSGNTPQLPPEDPASVPPGQVDGTTPITVHAMLLLFTATDAEVAAWSAEVEQALVPQGVHVVHRRPIALHKGDDGIVREHFGFADGMSQPVPFDPDATVPAAAVPNGWNAVALGDVLLGHINGHHDIAAGPVVPIEPDGRTAAAGLPRHPRAGDAADFGLNGTFLAVRELLQDVPGFWTALTREAARLRTEDPHGGDVIDATWLGERVIGRCMAGDALRANGPLPRNDPATPDNEFGFYDDDQLGYGCPIGAHMRRGNPRDGLAQRPDQVRTLREAANRHRILRRGRKFGPPIADRMVDDGVERGLLFLAINTDIERQFEFIMQTWMMNPNFATLFDEADPLVGTATPMSLQAKPLRRKAHLENFVKLAGGDYFFLPSLPALKYLELL
ncbi:Dyp-type peroxidase [Novosphingobium lentum]|uniref:Dyp-type peroxidase n=1 Tax=Novosphingobium lentum TaxID=145287 RepID=UPI00082B9B93|nr:hypothetical protein [Novosphingobium lentum]